jgi:RHH-type rel operon transcriptional repressor/antitoxin RelB
MGTVTARIPDKTASMLDELAAATKRSKSFLVAEALQNYLEAHAWQVARTQDSLEQAEQGRFASGELVSEAFAKMGVKVD